jgi:hypothetical protein
MVMIMHIKITVHLLTVTDGSLHVLMASPLP